MTLLAPGLSPEQRAAASMDHKAVPRQCMVTGSSGVVGQRLVEMLIERGAERVVAFDIAPPPTPHWDHKGIEYVKGDLRSYDDIVKASKGVECMWHNGAAVGPFHPMKLYHDINYKGTVNVINACKANKIPKLVYSSSPSTRFDGTDVDGKTEDEMPKLPQASYIVEYAKGKAEGELAVREACCDELLTVSVAPHQVYGPRDTLFLPNILETGSSGRLRVFGDGQNRICFSHIDNYCHGLILGCHSLYKGSPTLGQFYVVTDGDTHTNPEGYVLFWDALEEAVTAMGFASIKAKMHLPKAFMFFLAYLCSFFTFVTGRKTKLTPFTVKMLVMHRWFKIDKAQQELGYKPLIPYNRGWKDTLEWFRTNWLPNHLKNKDSSGFDGIAAMSEEKINRQK